MDIPKDAGARFSVETFSGDVSTTFPVTIPRSRGEGHMEFTLGDGRASVTATTFSGRIVINNGDSTRREQE
jgi:hypothetical protein